MGVNVPAPISEAPPHLFLKTHASRSTIEHPVLLNLLGAPHPLVRFYFPDTAWLLTSLSAQGHRSATQASLDLPCSAVVFQPQSRDFLMRGSPSEYSRRLRQPHWIAVSQILRIPSAALNDNSPCNSPWTVHQEPNWQAGAAWLDSARTILTKVSESCGPTLFPLLTSSCEIVPMLSVWTYSAGAISPKSGRSAP
jgi:hypothetical protein